jgi:calcium-dependent protein kinase
MHRDIKPENILYVHAGEYHFDSRIKLIDFGSATKFSKGETFTEVIGSPYYMAPDILN